MVTRRQAIRSALRIGYQLFGDELRQLISQYGQEYALQFIKSAAERVLSPKDASSVQNAINLVTPERPVSKPSPAFERLREQVKRTSSGTEKVIKRRRVGMPIRRSAKRYSLGTYQGRFKAKKKVSKKVKFDCVCKDERALAAPSSVTKCTYALHCTHPPKYILRMIGMAIVHKYAQQCHVKIRNWTDYALMIINYGTGSSKPGFDIYAVYQERIGSSSVTQAGDLKSIQLYTDNTADTWLAIADKIAEQLAVCVTEFANDIWFTQIQFRPKNLTTELQQLAVQVWDADDMYIEIKGTSHLQLQNRTPAGGGTDTASADNINANPLEGKLYEFNGTGLRANYYDAPARTSASTMQLVPDGTSGLLAFGSDDTNLTAPMQDALKQPPNAKFFKRVSRVGKIRLEPGAIKKSYLTDTVRMSFNGWIRRLYRYLSSGNTLNGTASTKGTASGALVKYIDMGIGKGAMVAMEKVADMGVSNILLPGERDAVYESRLYFKLKKFTVATNNQLPLTAAESAPA